MAAVSTQQGLVEGFQKEGLLQYRGIPYAASPSTPDLRFHLPAPPLKRHSVLKALEFSPSCPEVRLFFTLASGTRQVHLRQHP